MGRHLLILVLIVVCSQPFLVFVVKTKRASLVRARPISSSFCTRLPRLRAEKEVLCTEYFTDFFINMELLLV